ncbi:MAG: glycoside hydrolase family 15 protein, partial [Actinomycetota bacterium]
DLFVGGNPWSLSAIWLGPHFAETGQIEEVYRHLNWCLKHAMLHDLIPEQSDKHTGMPASAAPLAWSHAWIIILLQELGSLLQNGAKSPTHEPS